MPTLEEVGKSLGLSYRQTFRRFAAVRHLIPESVRKGDNGLLVLDGGAVEVLRRVEDSRKEGRTLREAVKLVARELDANGGNGSGNPWNGDTPEALRAKVAALDRENALLRDELARVWGLVDRLPALPAPRRWWRWWG
ncbi:TPA: hypothetical protein DCY67_02185 [Candidatus Acetothermia bacterium]|nr:hypothetical protein [Candidatus Acetothermia bacterium]